MVKGREGGWSSFKYISKDLLFIYRTHPRNEAHLADADTPFLSTHNRF